MDFNVYYVLLIIVNYVSYYEIGVGILFNVYVLLGVLQSVDNFVDCFMWVDLVDNCKKYYCVLD